MAIRIEERGEVWIMYYGKLRALCREYLAKISSRLEHINPAKRYLANRLV